MADTSYIKKIVEPYIRQVLAKEHEQGFEPRRLPLRPGGYHEFNAVSDDLRVVAGIRTASGLTVSGGIPSGKIKACIAELYYLTLVRASARMLILTSLEFHEIFSKAMRGKIADGIEIRCVSLPLEIERHLSEVQSRASDEVSPTRLPGSP